MNVLIYLFVAVGYFLMASHGSGMDATLTIAFPGGTKKIIARFANLTRA